MNRKTCQEFINELKKICDKYKVDILGTCEAEGIYGEISILKRDDPDCTWKDVKSTADYKAYWDQYNFIFNGEQKWDYKENRKGAKP